jgi:hypothetical protein
VKKNKSKSQIKQHKVLLSSFQNSFGGFEPFSGKVKNGFIVDFVGVRTRSYHRGPWANRQGQDLKGGFIRTQIPTPNESGEFWFEALNWFESAKSARNKYVMFSLGAHFGYQAVGAALTLMKTNPMPFTLVCVEPEPTQIIWIKEHMLDNGIDPDKQWIVPLVLGANSDPIFFPVGAPGSGAQNSFSTNEHIARENYVKELISRGKIEQSLRNLIMNNSTSIEKTLIPNTDMSGEIKVLSATTLSILLGPFDYVDFIESDIQESEKIVFPEAIELLTKKVKRISIGTHGQQNHRDLVKLFDFLPNTTHQTDMGSLEMNDGVLVVLNPFI